jgi:hypothetical protein
MKALTKIAVILFAGSTLLFAGCGGGGAIGAFNKMVDDVCACKDIKCTTGVATAFAEKMKKDGVAKPTGDDAKKMAAGTKKMTDCMKKLATGAASSATKKAAPAKAPGTK